MDLTLSSSVQYVPRVGPKMAKKLKKLGVKTVEDLLWYAPFRYNDFSLVSPISRVQPGETVTVRGEVISMKNAFTKTGKKLQQARVRDETGTLDVIWFNQMYLANIIKPGKILSLSGKADWFGHSVVLVSPQYEIFNEQGLHTGRLVPVYSETEGLSSKWLRGRIAFALGQCKEKVFEYVPDAIRKAYNLIDIQRALEDIHYPPSASAASQARERFAFDELFLLLLEAKRQRHEWEQKHTAYPIQVSTTDTKSFIDSLPFALTSDQKRAIDDIVEDLAKPVPMNRLLEGDVGAGKTVVAAVAMYAVFLKKFQSALMAPTEILARQHYDTLERFLGPRGVGVALVTGSKKKIPPAAHVFVGTHALLSATISFDRVGLVVVDEQQRFGVEQRALLRKKGERDKTPHFLTMTATPIPRTVAQTIYNNLDLSVLTDMPAGRPVVKTWLVGREKREKAYAWMRTQLARQGSQAFIVCPLIEQSESLTTVKAARSEYEILKNAIFPELRLGLLHGRLKPAEKSHVLAEFRNRSLDILVTTPVVEVGIDIPNATIMVIEAAERFGLAQLHQLRGRVGRGTSASYCLLFTEQENDTIVNRLKAMERIHSGTQLAELDLTMRGPGDILGTRQHGLPPLKVASLSDTLTLQKVQRAVGDIAVDPTLSQFPLLREKLAKGTIETAQD